MDVSVLWMAIESEKPAELLKRARALATNAEGMTLDEITKLSKVGQRTVGRRCNAIEAPLDRTEDGRLARFRMNGRGLGGFAAMLNVGGPYGIGRCGRVGAAVHDNSRAEILRSLHEKIRASARRGIVTAVRACGRPDGLVARMTKISYNGYRFPPEIIQQAIWLYLRFTLSFRDVEDLLAERGITVSYHYCVINCGACVWPIDCSMDIERGDV
jgi:hypothetical protein